MNKEEMLYDYIWRHSLSYRDVAVQLNVPRDTVKSWIRRFRDANDLIVMEQSISGSRETQGDAVDSLTEKLLCATIIYIIWSYTLFKDSK